MTFFVLQKKTLSWGKWKLYNLCIVKNIGFNFVFVKLPLVNL